MTELLHDTNVWVAISFAIFVLAVFKIVKVKFLGMLDTRIDEIKKEIQTAENLRIEAQELLALYQRKQRDAAKEADEIVETAKAHAAEIKKQADKDLKELMKRREAQLKERLARMEENARREISDYAADLAVKATYEIINDQMTAKSNQNIVDSSIKNVAGQLAS